MKKRDNIRTNRDEEPLSSAASRLFRCSGLQGSQMYFANTGVLIYARQSYGIHKNLKNLEGYDVFKSAEQIYSEKKGFFFTPIKNVFSSILGQGINYSDLNLSYFTQFS